MAAPGQNPQEVLQQLLTAQGMSEAQLAGAISREMTVNQLGNAIQSGFLETSKTIAEDLARYENETRTLRLIEFKNKDYTKVEEPSDEKLEEFYQSIKETYAIPEMRKSQVILIEKDALKNTLEISDEEIQEVYDRNITAYKQPQQRSFEHAILADEKQAAEIRKQVEEGKDLKDAVQAVTGNTTDYIPARSFEKDGIIEDLREDIFTAKEQDLIGPVQSPLGYHIARIQKITPARTTPLDEVSKTIKEELSETRLLDMQYDLAASVDDFLAAGEPLETLQQERGIKIQDMPLANRFDLDKDNNPVFAPSFGPDAQTLTTILFDLAQGEASPVTELADGRMAALLVTEIQDKSYKPFEDVKDSLKKRWINDARRVQNKVNVLEILSKARNKKTAFETLAKAQNKQTQTLSGLKRKDAPKAPLTAPALKTVFETPQGELLILDLEDGVSIAEIQSILLPETPPEDARKAAQNTALQAQQNEAYRLYVENLREKYGVKVNEKLLNAVYGTQTEQ
jgi:peptidyl-prolyl cis-trans isomerase D